MHMMAPQFAPVNSLQTDPSASSTSEDLSSAAQNKKTSRWTETEEKILIELFGENEEKLRYKAYTSPEWESIAKHERRSREHVSSDNTAQQCKNKMSNLTKNTKQPKTNSGPLDMEKGEMLRVTTKQKATLSLCLNIIRTWTKSSAIEKPPILDTCWRVFRRSKLRVSHNLIKTSAINKFWMRKFVLLRPLKRGNLSSPMIFLARLVN